MEMKKEISPVVIIGVIVVILGLVGFGIYQALNSTASTVHVTTTPDKNAPPATVKGQPVPPGVPYDYAVKSGMAPGGPPASRP